VDLGSEGSSARRYLKRQGVQWRLALSGLRAAPSDIAVAELSFACTNVRGLQGFDDISKVSLLVFLELWLGTYLLSYS